MLNEGYLTFIKYFSQKINFTKKFIIISLVLLFKYTIFIKKED